LRSVAKLTFVDLGKLFDDTGAILNEFSRLWEDMTTVMELIVDDDYTGALNRIAEANTQRWISTKRNLKSQLHSHDPRRLEILGKNVEEIHSGNAGESESSDWLLAIT
jgi:hypothetical protein